LELLLKTFLIFNDFGPVKDTTVDNDAGLIYVYGDIFGTQAGSVRIGDNQLTVQSWQPGEIIARLPPGFAAGGYLMSVINSFGQKTTQAITLGTAGAQRPRGTPMGITIRMVWRCATG